MIRAGTGSSTATNPRKAAVEATTAALQQAGLRTADCGATLPGKGVGSAGAGRIGAGAGRVCFSRQHHSRAASRIH